MLTVEHLDAGYGDTLALRDVTLAVAAGEFLGVLGPNGCGKTTLLRVLRGTLRPRTGHVRLEGRDLRAIDARALARTMAYLPQELAIELDFTVRELALMGRSPHVSRFVARVGRRPPRGRALDGTGRRAAPGRPPGNGSQRRRAAAGADRHVPRPGAEDTAVGRADEPSRSRAPVVDPRSDRAAQRRRPGGGRRVSRS